MTAIEQEKGAPPRPVDDGSALLNSHLFERVSRLAETLAGLSIPAAKRAMVQSRLSRRLHATGHASYDAYLDFVESPGGSKERHNMISALTTNVSHFFRERHHFETLQNEILPGLLARARRGDRVRLWSAGCSTGQEPYSIAMALLDAEPDAGNLDIRVLATDIDLQVLSKARDGLYDLRTIAGLPSGFETRFFEDVHAPDYRRVTDGLRDLVVFRHLNLIESWPMRGRFDVIFCRNVLIYFSEATQRALWPRFRECMTSEGWLFLGHSERIQEPNGDGFRSTGVTTYRRTPQDSNPSATRGGPSWR